VSNLLLHNIFFDYICLDQFLLVDRREKIESGKRTTSFSFLLNDKHSSIGKMLSAIPVQYREASFMGGQLGQ
jgi:hypothetical protein